MKNYNDFGKMMIRRSFFPYSTLFDPEGNTLDLDRLAENFLNDKQFLEGIYWSSGYLFDAIGFLKKGEEITGKKREKLLIAIKKYIIRACSRPTPFGTFAGVSVQNISGGQEQKTASGRGVRIDMSLLKKIVRLILNDPVFADKIQFHLNNTLYEVAGQYRFLEINNDDDSDYQVSSLEKTEILNRIVATVGSDDLSFDDLFSGFSAEYEYDEFHPFWKELVSMSFLVSELEASLTTNDSLDDLEAFLYRPEIYGIEESRKYRGLTERIQEYIKNIEDGIIGEFQIDGIRSIKKHLEELGVEIGEDQIFQVDLLHPGNRADGLTSHDLKNIEASIQIIGKVTRENNHLKDTLLNFAARFTERYESRSVPLLQVLDVDVGIGYPATGNIGYNPADFPISGGKEFRDSSLHNLSDWLLNKVHGAIWERKNVEIKDSDIRELRDRECLMSDTFYVGGQKIDGENILLQNIGGKTANSILSRFAYLSPEIDDLCRQIAGFEKNMNKDAVFADIVWTPGSKVSNVLRRVSHYDYEIQIFYGSPKNGRKAIPLSDLWVTVERSEVILSSRKLNKRIIPILSNAHNVLNTKNPIYSFLSALQYQDANGIGIRCDLIQNRYRFFPRISYKNMILFPAQWLVSPEDIPLQEKEELKDENLYKYLRASNIPQYVTISFADNELFLDIHNRSYREILLDEIRKKSQVILKEWLYGAADKKNLFIDQFILPLSKNVPLTYNFKQPIFEDSVERVFVPGSEWLYFKIYCSSGFSDEVLKQIYTRAIVPLKESAVIKKWFFIRYLDPHFHLRLRLKLTPKRHFSEIISLIKDVLISYYKNGVVWDIGLDTYRREIERYGQEEMDFSENVFYLDSESFIQILLEADIEENKEFRLLSSVKNVDAWLDSYGMNLKEKMNFCSKMVEHYAVGKSGKQLSDLNEMFKQNKNQVFEFLKSESLKRVFELRSSEMYKNHGSVDGLADYIHMSVNRWFAAQQKDWEYLSYYCCRNSYARLLQTAALR